jgi:hypothetical protein
LSDFFSSVFTTETTDNYPSLEGINISYNMGTLVIDEEKVKKRLHKLNLSKSPGPDGLHTRILHDLYEELGSSSILVHLSNTYSNWSDVDRPEMKPNCFGENKVFLFIWFTIWSPINFSSTLQSIHVRLTGL